MCDATGDAKCTAAGLIKCLLYITLVKKAGRLTFVSPVNILLRPIKTCMRKILVLAVVVFTALASCKKEASPNCGPVNLSAPASEVETLRTYISTNSIAATEDPRGFFYSISTAGSGTKPTVCNAVTVNYSGRLTNGTVFDSATGVQFSLGSLILGWQEGIPLVAPGGSITLYLPPSLGYGSSAVGSIPANSILIFTIDLIAVN